MKWGLGAGDKRWEWDRGGGWGGGGRGEGERGVVLQKGEEELERWLKFLVGDGKTYLASAIGSLERWQ